MSLNAPVALMNSASAALSRFRLNDRSENWWKNIEQIHLTINQLPDQSEAGRKKHAEAAESLNQSVNVSAKFVSHHSSYTASPWRPGRLYSSQVCPGSAPLDHSAPCSSTAWRLWNSWPHTHTHTHTHTHAVTSVAGNLSFFTLDDYWLWVWSITTVNNLCSLLSSQFESLKWKNVKVVWILITVWFFLILIQSSVTLTGTSLIISICFCQIVSWSFIFVQSELMGCSCLQCDDVFECSRSSVCSQVVAMMMMMMMMVVMMMMVISVSVLTGYQMQSAADDQCQRRKTRERGGADSSGGDGGSVLLLRLLTSFRLPLLTLLTVTHTHTHTHTHTGAETALWTH